MKPMPTNNIEFEKLELGDDYYVYDEKTKKPKKFKVAGIRRDQEGNILDYIAEERETVKEEIISADEHDETGKPTKITKHIVDTPRDNFNHSALQVSKIASKAKERHGIFTTELEKFKKANGDTTHENTQPQS